MLAVGRDQAAGAQQLRQHDVAHAESERRQVTPPSDSSRVS